MPLTSLGQAAGGGGGGGANLADFRLASMSDAGGHALGAFGDEMEYTTRTALLAAFTRIGGTDAQLVPSGSSVAIANGGPSTNSTPLIILKTGLTLPSNFEVGVLFSQLGPNGLNMASVLITDDSGNGIGAGPYWSSPGLYIWNVTAGVYASTNSSAGAGALGFEPRDGGPFWILLKKTGTTWSARLGNNALTSFYGPFTGTSSQSPTAIGAGTLLAITAPTHEGPRVERIIYGAADLGV